MAFSFPLIALKAEEINHHPIENIYNNVSIILTHDLNGISDKDEGGLYIIKFIKNIFKSYD